MHIVSHAEMIIHCWWWLVFSFI